MSRIKIVNRRNERETHYCGRGSPLGNPFKMREEKDRDRVCEEYKVFFKKQIEDGNKKMIEYLDEILKYAKRGNEVKLGCYCFPKRCHCETIKQYIEDRLREEES